MPESSKKLKSYLNGIEFTTSIFFTAWQPGFEYTKNVSLKNLNTRTVKVNYQLPKTRFYTTLFPKPISLSPGTTFTLPITFRPLEKVPYEDYIEIYQVDFEQAFKIPLRSDLPQLKLEFDAELNLGSCAVNESVSKTIKVQNTSELDTLFEWEFKAPFSVEPITGEIKAFSSLPVTFTFQPSAALVYNAKAVCRFGSQPLAASFHVKPVELHATGKYPHILLEGGDAQILAEATVDFGQIMTGQTVTRTATIVNMTEVSTSFFIEKNSKVAAFDACFNCLHLSGVLQPFEKLKIPITYSSNTPSDDVVYDYFLVYSSTRLSKSVITCKATNQAAQVRIDKDIINFDLCMIGNQVAQTFKIINNSSLSLPFQFDTDSESSPFKLSQSNGVIQANESKLIQVFFKPQHPLIYYKKIPCLIQDHDILYVEMIGTCHLDLIKPSIINRKNIEIYYYLKNENLLGYAPEQLTDLYSIGKLKIDENKIRQDYLKMKGGESGTRRIEEYLSDGFHSGPDRHNDLVVSDSYYVDFGACKIDPHDELINEQHSVTISNKTRGKLVFCWHTYQDQPFVISPNSCEIPPLKNYSFIIKFTPNCADQFYQTRLEGYAMYKSLSDYTLFDPKLVIPSWCVNIQCLGHTFHPSNDTFFLPKYTASAESIIFPPSVVDKAAYRTFVLKNIASKYPLVFDFKSLNSNELFVKPQKGVIRKNEHQIFVFKFTPRTDSCAVEKCEIMLNYLPKHVLEVPFVGAGTSPRVHLENEGVMYFAPTCRNNASFQTYQITNLSRSRVVFEWKIPFETKDLFSVDEVKGCLEPFQIKKTEWKFSPEKVDKYNHKVALITWIEGETKSIKVFYVRLLGSSTNGSLQATEMYKDFGNVIVGSSISSEVVLVNNNDCDLDYELFVRQSGEESEAVKYKGEIVELELESSTGRIQARSKTTIRCRLRPTRLVSYQFTVEYQIVYPNEKADEGLEVDSSSSRSMREVLCYMTASGVYPKLKINDIKALGSASNLSKDYLWKLLSVNDLNSSMNCEPNPDELIYSIATRQEANRRAASQNSKPMIDMNFSAAPLNSHDTLIILFIENVGLVPTDWTLLYPKDLLLELEYWAQSGEYDLDELEEMKVQDNKLFLIEPKKGHLEPGEIAQIQVTYRHLFSGHNKLPVLFKIDKGREILLNLIGTTIPNNEPSIYFPSGLFELEPIEIGLIDYPAQIYELYNGGDVACDVEIDASAVDELNEANYAQPILKCVSPDIVTVLPGSILETKWKFCPIEAKTYEVDIVFKVNKVHFTVVTFKCIGYDKRKLKNMTIANKAAEIPVKQTLMLPNQLASLSLDRINLGNLPLFSRERKIVFVKNNSAQNKVSFTWHVTNPEHATLIRIQPSRGEMEVGQSKMCKVTFIAKGRPSFYNIDLICEIKNESEMDIYRKELELWESEQKRQYEEFIIDEKELENRLKKPREPRDSSSQQSEKSRGSQLSIHKFKTIPPIAKSNQLEETHVERVRRLREEKKLWKKPSPPAPFLLHLNVLGRTQFIDEFLSSQNAVKNDCSKFVDPLLGNASENADDPPATNEGLSCNEEEKQALNFVLSDLLRNLVYDKSFHMLVQKVKDEPIPYFFQYSGYNEALESKEVRSTGFTSEKFSRKEKKPNSNDDASSALKTSPFFGSLIENILENTVANILTEAFNKEFNLTSRPRLIALPPKTPSNYVSSSNFSELKRLKNADIMTTTSPTLSIKSSEFQ